MLYDWLILISVLSMAIVSPGPDFVMVVRNSITYSRKVGLLTSLGFGLGIIIHVTCAIAGIASLVAQSAMLFTTIKFIGGAYLIYIGFKSLKSEGFKDNELINSPRKAKTMSNFAALRSGFITNLFNPKATLFYLALFTQILDPNTPTNILINYGVTCVALTIVWFSMVSVFLTTPKIKNVFLDFSKWIDRVCGTLLIALGIKLGLSKIH